MYLVVNGTRTNFDRQATEIHELGHTLGLAHSTVGWSTGNDGALSRDAREPVADDASVLGPRHGPPTLEADDVAALSELYPEASFSTTTGTITGTVTRCGTGEPVLGANVRAINVANPAIQLTRVTGFDGETDGSYTIKGVPPGTYKVVVEPLSGDSDFLTGWPCSPPSTPASRRSSSTRPWRATADRTPTRPRARTCRSAPAASRRRTRRWRARRWRSSIDVTGSMGPEIGAIKTALEAMISALEAVPGSFPNTSIVTFDDAAQIRLTSRDPDRLREVIAGLTTHSTSDCPEGSNAAAMTAGRLLGSGGRAVLVTDAESRPNGPSRTAVDELYAEKNARLSVLLSGNCPPGQGGAGRGPHGRARGHVERHGPGQRDVDTGRGPARRRARRRGRHPHVHRGEPLLRRPVQLPARGEGRRRGREGALLEHARQPRDLVGAAGGRGGESHRRCRRAPRSTSSSPGSNTGFRPGARSRSRVPAWRWTRPTSSRPRA